MSPELLAEWKRLEDAFHDSLPSQGETGDPSHGKVLCQFLYDNSEAIRAEIERLQAVVERVRSIIERGYLRRPKKNEQCQHGRYGFEDCIACYDDALLEALASIQKDESQ